MGQVIVNSKVIYSYEGSTPAKMLSLFTDIDVIRIVGPYSEPKTLMFEASGVVLRDRLDALGYSEGRLREQFDRLRAEELERKVAFRPHLGPGANKITTLEELDRNIEDLGRLTYAEWRDRIRASVTQGVTLSEETVDGTPYLPAGNLDQLLILRAICTALDDRDSVVLDLRCLTEGARTAAYLDEPIDDVPVIINVDRPSPVIVITEGAFDAYVLRHALGILKPHLVNYIRFLDEKLGHEGGASSAVKTLRSFAAAGVSNRVVALFDNDSAAYQALLPLAGVALPPHYSVLHYPYLELAATYPTFGPQGDSIMDVNGLAGSIELYLGVDVLTNAQGDLEPVQWTGYQSGVKRYQGEVYNKKAVQEAFRQKVKRCERDPKTAQLQDWSPLELVFTHLMDALTELP